MLQNHHYKPKFFDTNALHKNAEKSSSVEQLLTLIQNEKVVVLHGDSVEVSTQLLHAQLLPQLEADGYQYRQVSFHGHEAANATSLLDRFHKFLWKGEDAPAGILNPLGPTITLWEQVKNWQWKVLQNRKDPLLIVFDSFGDIFSYPEAVKRGFLHRLSELINDYAPGEFIGRLSIRLSNNPKLLTDQELDFILNSPLNTKIVLCIESDKVKPLKKLALSIPRVIHNLKEKKY